VINLLKVLSFFDPERIQLDMITQGAEALSLSLLSGLTLSDTVAPQAVSSHLCQTKRRYMESVYHSEVKTLLRLILSPIQLQDAIAQLQNRSLIKHIRSADTPVLRIHDLINIMVQANLTNSGTDRGWFDIAVDLAWSAFQLVEDPESYKCWVQCAMFAPHFHLLTMRDEIRGGQSIPIMKANRKIARYLRSSGRYNEAETLLGQTLAASEKQLGVEHPDTLEIMYTLALVYTAQGHYDEAEIQYRHVLALREKQLGSEHPDTLNTMYGLAGVYRILGRHSEAEAHYKLVLALREKQLGLEHPATLHIMHGLALVYTVQGRHSEAETQFKHVLALTEKQRGLEHPDTVAIMHSLALIYYFDRRYSEAEALYKRALMLREKQFGTEHPETLSTMCNLELVYISQGRHGEAEALRKRAKAIRERKLAKEHPDASCPIDS
jgi:tetratricopeptide (TPR) repeat protein